MSSTLNHCHMNHSNFLLLLIYKFQQWETWLPPSAIYLLNYSISLYLYINMRIVNQYPHGTQPYQVGYRDYVQFCLPLCCLHTPHISKDTSGSTFSPTCTGVASLIYNTVGFFCQSAFFPRVRPSIK